jgi:hypothetical protein
MSTYARSTDGMSWDGLVAVHTHYDGREVNNPAFCASRR